MDREKTKKERVRGRMGRKTSGGERFTEREQMEHSPWAAGAADPG